VTIVVDDYDAAITWYTEALGFELRERVGFFLHVDDFTATHDRLTAAGGRLVEGPRSEPYGTVGVFEDLYGNRWDLIQRVAA
jgi:predicted enzyme related to lactoylglutathione lyase